MSQGIDPVPQPIQENDYLKLLSCHPVLLLVSFHVGVTDLATVDVLLCAHSVYSASHAVAFPLQRG